MFKAFGKAPSGKRSKLISRSPHYKDGTFSNVEETPMMLEGTSYGGLMMKFITNKAATSPPVAFELPRRDLSKLNQLQDGFIWFGHSSYLIRSNGFTILVDPVLSGYASPFSFFGKSFKGTSIYSPEDLPSIDLLLLTHDHYDHLDYSTIVQIKDRVAKVVTPLGVGSHLEYWGYDMSRVSELDWWDHLEVNDFVNLTCTPARHFSGRTLKRNTTLWASYCLQIGSRKIFIGGDSGYDQQFRLIGTEKGPFDLAFLECGQYGDSWPFIHMKPEETVRAAIDLHASRLIPVHWGKFSLAYHAWDEPVTRLLAEAEKKKMVIFTPTPGEFYKFDSQSIENRWWIGK